MMYGDAASYYFMGDCGEPGRIRYEWFNDKYEKLGYTPIPFNEFIIAGGYRGASHLQKFLRKEKRNDT